jgi:hypothetical protein
VYGLEMERVGIFYGPLVCFTAIWYILLSFGIFWVSCKKEKSGNTGMEEEWNFFYIGS